MQAELALELGEGTVDLLAINEIGHEANAWGTRDAE
jgi:hypothetical protein